MTKTKVFLLQTSSPLMATLTLASNYDSSSSITIHNNVAIHQKHHQYLTISGSDEFCVNIE